jgi:hypothetical protein
LIEDYISSIKNLEYRIKESENKLLLDQIETYQEQIKILLDNNNKTQENIQKMTSDFLLKYEENNSSHQKEIIDLKSSIELQESVNMKLNIHNTQLTEYIKQQEISTQLENKIQVLTIIGNFVFIGIQCVNA